MILLRRLTAGSAFGLVTIASIVALVCLVLFAPPDGNERAPLLQFIGRIHPLTVHLPIALLLLVPVFEIGGKNRKFSYLLPACSFVLGVSTIGSIVAAGLGWCLAHNGGYTGRLVTQHMWVGLLSAAGTWLCWRLRVHSDPERVPMAYAAALFLSVVSVSFAGYRGGQLSLGETHLTEYMPETIASLLGVSNSVEAPSNSPYGGPGTFYGARIQPIFARNCLACHGRNKHKGRLRLDSFEAVMHGGEHGPVIKPGEARASEILRRISLSPSDRDFMPQEHSPVPAGDVQLIEQWISMGASGTMPRDATPPSGGATPALAEVSFEVLNPAATAKQRSEIDPIVAQLQQRIPNVVDYQSRGSADIVVNAAWMRSRFGDTELAALNSIADHVVSADFSSTAISDKSVSGIAAMKHLHVLRLAHTQISDEGLRSLRSLTELQSLTLFDTRISAAGLDALAGMSKLQRIYVGGTRISSATHVSPEIEHKIIF